MRDCFLRYVQSLTCDTGLAGTEIPLWSGHRIRWRWTWTAVPAGVAPQRACKEEEGGESKNWATKVQCHDTTFKTVASFFFFLFTMDLCDCTQSPHALTLGHTLTHRHKQLQQFGQWAQLLVRPRSGTETVSKTDYASGAQQLICAVLTHTAFFLFLLSTYRMPCRWVHLAQISNH